MTVLAALMVGATGKVFAFEPNPPILQGLLRHIVSNELGERVQASRLAISCRRSTATFFVSALVSNSGLSSLTPHSELLRNRSLNEQCTIQVDTVSLDEWLAEHLSDCCVDFIKVDVEGAEMLVLEGAKGTLANRPPKRWLIETQPEGPVVGLLSSYGYTMQILDAAGDHANLLFTHSGFRSELPS